MKRARVISVPPHILRSLGQLQDSLNRFINKNWRADRSADDWALAVTMESCELMDSYPWKWWKNIHATPDYKNVKIELVDILHFALSGTMQLEGTGELQAVPANVDKEITAPLTETKNAIRTFRSVISLATLQRFDLITEFVIAAAADLDFNMVGYYVAKHTLNVIRQLQGYKQGTYVKNKNDVEDNELLHQCLDGVTVEAVLAEGDAYIASWDLIMGRVYDAFNVESKDRRVTSDWLSKKE